MNLLDNPRGHSYYPTHRAEVAQYAPWRRHLCVPSPPNRFIDPCEVASTFIAHLGDGSIEQVVALLDPTMEAAEAVGNAEALVQAWHDIVLGRGQPAEVDRPVWRSAVSGGGQVVTVGIRFEHDVLQVRVTVSETGKVQGFYFQPLSGPGNLDPLWTKPSYAAVDGVTEREIVVDDGEFVVPGTLCLPVTTESVAVVLLLPGSGPTDRDSTIGPNKPLKDIAWGLAARGIATLRYDKVTCAHRDQLMGRDDLTVSDEYVTHALAAIELLSCNPSIDPARIYVLGHSQGGSVAPRIATQTTKLAGLIILAGSCQPFHHVALRQVRYLRDLDASGNGSMDLVVEEFARQADLIDSVDFDCSTPASELPFGVSAAYLLDLLAHDPAEIASHLDLPILLLQGGRDYQVTVEDDLSRWTAALANSSMVTVHVYPDADHYFFVGTGPSTPDSYRQPQHVAKAVIDDIATWIEGKS